MKYIALTAMLIGLPFSVSADELRYQAIWHSGTGTNIVTGPETRADFIATGERETAAGRRLIDVETAMVDGQRIYSGLWIGGTGTNLFDGPIGPIEMRNLKVEREAQGLRMVDFEVLRSPEGGRRYLAVWRPGTGEQVLTGPMQQAAFLARGQRLVEDDGMRLIDVEVERRQGVLLYHGLFRTGSGSNFITTPLRFPAFLAKRQEMRDMGLELVDVERIVGPGRERFVGVWASGDGEGQLSVPRSFPAFVEFGQQHTADGFRTEDMELRVAATQPAPGEPPEDDPGPGSGDSSVGPTTADLPGPPDWITITDSGNANIVLRLGSQANNEQGYHLTIHHSLLPENLPMDDEFNQIIPDNICGLRIFRPSATFWETADGELVEDGTHLANMSYGGELATHALHGIDFTGPMGACDDNDGGGSWQFPFPLTTGDHDAATQSLRLIVEFPDPVAFLNFNIHPGEPLDASELFSDDVFEKLKEIAENFAELNEDNGYCEGVQGYMIEVCDENPGLCPVEDPEAGC